MPDDRTLRYIHDTAKQKGWRIGQIRFDHFAKLFQVPQAKMIETALRLEEAYDDANPDYGMPPGLGSLACDLAEKANRL